MLSLTEGTRNAGSGDSSSVEPRPPNSRPEADRTTKHASVSVTPPVTSAAQQAVAAAGRASLLLEGSVLSPVVKYHGLARRYLMPSGFLMRPLLNGGTLGGRTHDVQGRPPRISTELSMTLQDLLLLVVVSATVGGLWGRIALRQSPFFESGWADVMFFLVMAGVTTAIYALLAARQVREDVDFATLIGIIVGGVAFFGAPVFASFRATRSTRRSELRGYAFALLAILGVGLFAMIIDLVHRLDDASSHGPGLTTLAVHGVLGTPALAALILVVTRLRRLPSRPARRNLSA
jgi:hypothetical protein